MSAASLKPKPNPTIRQWLHAASQTLEAAGIPLARLDAQLLLADALQKDKAWLVAHDDVIVDDAQITLLQTQIERRCRHEPLAYIRQTCEFYGRDFYVDAAVLVPRPESETMIDLLKQLAPTLMQPNYPLTIIDIGTGSGALAISAALELPHAQVSACDIDTDALRVAQRNIAAHAVSVDLLQSDLLPPNHTYQVIIANLPYVPDGHTINQAAMIEPALAIFGGPDGLDLYRRLFMQISNRDAVERPILLFCESLPTQHHALAQLAKEHGYSLQKSEDFIQVFAFA